MTLFKPSQGLPLRYLQLRACHTFTLSSIFYLLLFVSFGAQAVSIPKPDLSRANKAIKAGYQEWAEQVNKAESGDFSNSKKAEAWGMLGMYLLAHDYSAQAQEALAQASHYMPLDARWHYLSAYVDQLNGENETALAKFEKAAALNPYYYPVMIRMGQLYLQQGELGKASEWFEKAQASQDTMPAALQGLGQIALQKGRPERARKLFQQALEMQPQASKLHFYLAQAFGALGQQDKAEQHLARRGDTEVALPDRLLSQVSALSRSTVKLNKRAVSALQQRQFQLAEKLAHDAIASDPENVHPKLTLAYIYSESGQHDKANETMQQVLKAAPGDPDLVYAAGVLREIAGDDNGAMSYYRQTLGIDTGHVKAGIALVKALMREKRFEEALALSEKLLMIDKESPFIPYRSGFLNLYLGNCKQAKADFYQAVSMQQTNFAFLTAYARTVAQCGGSKEEITQALNAARNMYRVKPLLPVIEVLAALEASYGDKEMAKTYQEQALFEAVKQHVNPPWFARLKNNYERFKNGQPADLSPDPGEEDMSPPRLESIL